MDIEKDLAEHVELAPLTKQNLADAERDNSGNMGTDDFEGLDSAPIKTLPAGLDGIASDTSEHEGKELSEGEDWEEDIGGTAVEDLDPNPAETAFVTTEAARLESIERDDTGPATNLAEISKDYPLVATTTGVMWGLWGVVLKTVPHYSQPVTSLPLSFFLIRYVWLNVHQVPCQSILAYDGLLIRSVVGNVRTWLSWPRPLQIVYNRRLIDLRNCRPLKFTFHIGFPCRRDVRAEQSNSRRIQVHRQLRQRGDVDSSCVCDSTLRQNVGLAECSDGGDGVSEYAA